MSISHETNDMPADFGTHQRLNNSGLLHASKTICMGASNVRVTKSSRSDLRFTMVRFTAAESSFCSLDIRILWLLSCVTRSSSALKRALRCCSLQTVSDVVHFQ